MLKYYTDGKKYYDTNEYNCLNNEEKTKLREISLDIPDNVPGSWMRPMPENAKEGYYFKYVCQSTYPK